MSYSMLCGMQYVSKPLKWVCHEVCFIQVSHSSYCADHVSISLLSSLIRVRGAVPDCPARLGGVRPVLC